MEGTVSPASIAIGDDNNQFQNDPNGGHDILLAGPGDMDFDAEGGDDIMVGTVNPTHRFEGMLGFDWTTYRGETLPVDADMLITGAIAVNAPLNELRDRFDLTEGLSGSAQNERLRGDDRTAAELNDDGLSGGVLGHHVLNAAGIARIAGLADILPPGATSWGEGNIILGGLGSDLLEGRGGNDILDGDRWLNVQLRGVLNDASVKLVDSLQALKLDVVEGRLSPANITMVRSIVTSGSAGIDTARFSGPRADYTIQGPTAAGVVTVTDNVGDDGTDTLRNIEQVQFPSDNGPDGLPRTGDETVFVTLSTGNNPPTGAPLLNQPLPQELEQLAVQNGNIADADGIVAGSLTFQWQQGAVGGGGFVNIAGATARQFTPQQAQVGQLLRAIISFTDGAGRLESVASAPSGVVGDVFNGTAVNDIFAGTAGRDDVSGAGGNDTLTTGDAADLVQGNAGNDTLNTGAGDDIAAGGAGDDAINTGSGNDTIRFNQADGFDTVVGGAGVDTIRPVVAGAVIGLASLIEVEVIDATTFGNNITIQGSDAANTLDFSAVQLLNIASINGGAGGDVITGSGVADTINGEAGPDTISGGGGADTLSGGGDNDTLTGGGGADTINGNGGNDVINGGNGDDNMDPGASLGNDVFVFQTTFGNDTITGFGATPSATVGQDLLDIRALGITAATFNANVTRVAQGTNTLITITGGGTITLIGVAPAAITAADFILAP
jgi:Ca2+-binding RTX toxin-like protein